MTASNEPPRDALDPADPRWVDEILARARRRAEALDSDPANGSPLPVNTSPPAARTPPPAPPRDLSPQRDLAPPRLSSPQPALVLDDAMPSVEPARDPRPRAPREDVFGEATLDLDTTLVSAAGADTLLAASEETGDDSGEEDEEASLQRRMRGWLEWGAVIVGALVVAFIIRALFFQAFYIPSVSMESTLNVHDRILVNKLSYRLHDVRRGDVVVFEKPPGEPSKINDLIKRVIALPGETIQQQGSDIYIDRGQGPQKLTETYLNDPAVPGPTIGWVQGCANPSTETSKCTIPEGHVWVMGDNRGHSHDSRMFGPIDEDLIVGRAFVKVWPVNKLGFL